MKWSVALLLAFSSCSFRWTEVGRPIPESTDLEIGVSTKSDVLALIGPPRLVRRQFDGELFVYRYLEGESRSINILPTFVSVFFISEAANRQDDLTLLFDKQGLLKGVGSRFETNKRLWKAYEPEDDWQDL